MSTAPSLFAQQPPAGPALVPTAVASEPRTLMDLFYPGFYMVFLLKNGQLPSQAAPFRERVKELLLQVDRGAKRLGLDSTDVYQAKFAFCGLLDEILLTSGGAVREDWMLNPLQLELFGEHMAGERFFERLEELRREGTVRLQALEVFHMCLLLGFQGKYALEGTEKLGYITARVGDEILHLQGRRSAFAPHWAPPDQIQHKLRSEVSLWVMGSVFALLGLLAFLGLRYQLHTGTEESLARYVDVVKLAPQSAWFTLTLP